MTSPPQPPSGIITARKPRPVRAPGPVPVARIVHSPSQKTLASIASWKRLTGRTN